MAVQLIWKGELFKREFAQASRDGMRRAAVFTHTQMRLAVNKSNRRGTQPSKPGEAPRKYTGFGQSGIVWEFDEATISARIGVTKNAIYMAYLELGTGPKIIRPKSASVLMIEWRGKVRPLKKKKSNRKKPSLKKYYLAISDHGSAFVVVKEGGKYWYFRQRVRIPPIAPRPFMVATVLRHKDQIARLATSGGPGLK